MSKITAHYAQDHDHTIFENEKIFNLKNLGDRLQLMPKKVAGINTPMGYAAGPGSSSAFHCEDVDLFSISFNIYGGVCKKEKIILLKNLF